MSVTLKVNVLSGHLCDIDIEPTRTTIELKLEIETATGIPRAHQRLLAGVAVLFDDQTLAEGLQGATEVLLVRLSFMEWMDKLEENVESFSSFPEEIREVKDVSLRAVERSHRMLKFVPETLLDDSLIIGTAARLAFWVTVGSSGQDLVLQTVIGRVPTGCMCPDFAIELLSHLPQLFQYLPSHLQNDEDVRCQALKLNGFLLRHIPKKEHTRILATAALGAHGEAAAYLCEDLMGDRDLALVAVRNSGLALQFFPDMSYDDEVVREALLQNNLAIQFVDHKLWMMPGSKFHEYSILL